MGSTSSKFRKALQNGEEYVAMQLYMNSPELRKSLDPNLSYGDNYNHDTPMHYVSRHGMKSLLRLFLKDLSGNPNKKNIRNETSIHSICMCANGRDQAIQIKRAECMYMMLQWEGALLRNGEREKADINAIDEKANTALHYAAQSGLKKSVELLVTHDVKLFGENKDKHTPCDVAEKNNHLSIALYLESKMVFSTDETVDCAIVQEISFIEPDEPYTGLRPQDLQEAKDQLLVETSDMLRVPLFTAEALLRNHEWSRENLLEAWMRDPIATCEKAGVKPPTDFSVDMMAAHRISGEEVHCSEIVCDICAGSIAFTEEPVDMPCNHQFCRECWQSYLTGKIQEGNAHNIRCPAFDCTKLVPLETIENLVSRDMARRYLLFDIKAFVDSNPHIKWCPAPGCGRAVKYPGVDTPVRGTATNYLSSPQTSQSVDCGQGHFFCWDCLGEAHEPCSCENLKKWHEKIAEVKPEELSNTTKDSESAANFLWLVTNSKPCPKCSSPIQKNEGCNHMKCTKCKYDFCWVCLEPWNKHGSATGGYFRCNRYEAVQKADEKTGGMVKEAEEKNLKMQELNKFVHYYTRFKNHENSYKLEQPLIRSAKEKMLILAKAVTDSANASSETKFIEEAINELLKARRALKFSYSYGYYLEDDGRTKTIFEFMQTELEEATETLSQMVARPYLRTPRYKIIQSAQLVQRKRHEFLSAVSKGLIPPEETPPLLRRKQFARKNIFNFENDEDGDALRQAIAASLQDMPPGGDGWMMDKTGRHNNIPLLYEYLGFDSEESDDLSPPGAADVGLSKEFDELSLTDVAESGVCLKPGCGKPRAKNRKSGAVHEYCGLKCMRQDRLSRVESDSPPYCEEENTINNDQIDLLRALEMSRLLLMEQTEQLDKSTLTELSTGLEGVTEENLATSLKLQLPAHHRQLINSPKLARLVARMEDKESDVQESEGTDQEENINMSQPCAEDMELQQVLELSCKSLKHTGESVTDSDLEKAIKLSLQDPRPSTSGVKKNNPEAKVPVIVDISDLLGESSSEEDSAEFSIGFPITKCNQTDVQYASDCSSFRRSELARKASSEDLDDELYIPEVRVHAPTSEAECDRSESGATGRKNVIVSEKTSDAVLGKQKAAFPALRVREHSLLRRTSSEPDSPTQDNPISDLLCLPNAHSRVVRSLSAPQEGVMSKSEPNSPGLQRNRRVESSPTERGFMDSRDSPHTWDASFLDYRVCRSTQGSPRYHRYGAGRGDAESQFKEGKVDDIWQRNVEDIWQKMSPIKNTKSENQISSGVSSSQTLEKAFESVHFPFKNKMQEHNDMPREVVPISLDYRENRLATKKNRHSVYSSSPSQANTLEVEPRRSRSVSPLPRRAKKELVTADGAVCEVSCQMTSVPTEDNTVKGASGVTKGKSDRRKRRERRNRKKDKEKEKEEAGWQLYV
ncbi:ankyrin repeat and IBR domain-containing protein 1-like [Saccoglossus kowalevskii]|uniref:RBR-type E3 ubiquitin transferase n=1 Tax=Saccoglossus kowalevskii TaxID=10224 RepID=A0ABM0GPV0_SACKO|nr:PREDICTED: ankyrin repeat and IBR domain-containing protein 1-like [Saccoglossus kowalevskii]